MVNPVFVIIGVLLVFWIFVKFTEVRHRLFGTILLIVILLLFLSISSVISSKNIDFKKPGAFSDFGKYYLSWLGQIFSNAKQITGSVVQKDWGLNNRSIGYLPNSTD